MLRSSLGRRLIESVSKLLGHSSFEMTMKYAHLAPEHLRKAVNMLEQD